MVEIESPAHAMKTSTLGLKNRLLLLAIGLSLFGAATILMVRSFFDVNLNMAILALVVCVISSLVAHVVGEYPKGDDNFAARLAGSLMARTAMPFLLVVIVKLTPGLPFERAFVLFIILFYLVGLIADVSMQVSRMNRTD
jgi:hypothetical protein